MSQYKTGTVAVTSGSAAIVGTGTLWATNAAAGQTFMIAGSSVPYVIGVVTDNTHITLSSNYAGSSQSGLSYEINTSRTPVLSIDYMEAGDIDSATTFKRAMLQIEALLTGAWNRLLDISGASGGQIKFPATQNASANANTLDDYEEGTWTPTATSSAGTITTVGAVSGSYTKVGRLTAFSFSIEITTNGTGSGYITIGGIGTIATIPANVTLSGYDVSTAKALAGGQVSSNQVWTRFYDGTYPGSSGAVLKGTFIVTE